MISPDVKRRRLLAVVGALATAGLGGCPGDGDGGGAAETPANRTATPTETATERKARTPSPDPYTMPAGSGVVAVTVHPDFEGEVEFSARCRGIDTAIPGGERTEVVRNEAGESCGVSVEVDGEAVLDRVIHGYESARLTVTADGDVDEEWRML